MRFAKFIIEELTRKPKTNVLGRWSITRCEKTMNQKVDLSNEDHCGPCGQYRMDKMSTNTTISAIPMTKHQDSK